MRGGGGFIVGKRRASVGEKRRVKITSIYYMDVGSCQRIK